MTLWELVRNEARDESRTLLITASLAGAVNATAIALINRGADAESETGKMVLFFLVVLCITLYVISSRRTYHRTTVLIERALEKIKLRIIDKIDRADLQSIEKLGTSEIYDRITENVSVISDSAGMISNVLQSGCILVCAAIYLLTMSAPAFALLVVLNLLAVKLYYGQLEEINARLGEVAQKRITFFDQLTDMLRGYRELRLSRKRSEDVRADVAATTREVRVATIKASNLFSDSAVFAQCLLFAMLLAMVFLLPQYVNTERSKVTTLVGAVLFFWGPLSGVVGGMPAYTRSSIALANIAALEDKLDQAARNAAPPGHVEDPWRGRFSQIAMQEVSFAYTADTDGHAFCVGPIDLTVSAGEVVFVVGGNGSGKSTFMKVLTGLYPATTGRIRLDNVTVQPENVAAYRELFSVIFSDFHLFSRLYGLLDVDEAAVQALLRQMRIEDKTSYENTRFTRRDLSTGQRKRLAMIVALLEDRPILVFDEWAADQDPEFRKYFYEELIPSLKKRGKTVIAVTHDDRYFHCADRVLTLEYGRMVRLQRPEHGDPIRAEAATE